MKNISAKQLSKIMSEVVADGFGAFPVLFEEPDQPYIFPEAGKIPRRGSAVYIYWDYLAGRTCWWVGERTK
jgi:hypothetical protein